MSEHVYRMDDLDRAFAALLLDTRTLDPLTRQLVCVMPVLPPVPARTVTR